MIRVLGGAVAVLALVVAVVPYATECQGRGREMLLADGSKSPMHCHFSARAETALAAPLLALGIGLAASRRRETRKALAAVGALLGAAVALVPTGLVGVCLDADMACHAVMRPVLVLAGVIAAAAALAAPALSERKEGGR